MTRHIRYIGENHFPPPENEGQPCRWVSTGGRFTFGPVTPALAAKLDAQDAARTKRPTNATEKRAEKRRYYTSRTPQISLVPKPRDRLVT